MFLLVSRLLENRKHVLLYQFYVKNINKASDDSAVKELTETLTYLSGKYNTTICNELSNKVVNFDILYDTLFIETSSFLVTEKTSYQNNLKIWKIICC